MSLGTPPQFDPAPPSDPSAAAAAVKMPAILLMVTSGLSVVLAGFAVIANSFMLQMMRDIHAQQNQPMPPIFETMYGPAGTVMNAFSALLSIVTFVGALRMMSLRSWGLAVTGAICAIVTCSCCFVGMGIGIWALVVLVRSDVKSAFR